MNNQTTLQKIIYFPLTRAIIGVAMVVGSVLLCEQLRKYFTDQTQLSTDLRDLIIAIMESLLAVIIYILVFRFFEKRKIRELSYTTFGKNAITGFLTALILQSLVIFVLYIGGGYSIIRVNPLSFLLPGFSTALTAGFVAEIMLRGILFRLMEEQTGTVLAMIFFTLLFVVLHIGAKGATFLSVVATTMQAGILVSAAYVYTRSLWFPVFFHFAWDFAEPAIYGGLNPGITVEKNLLTSKFSGSVLLTGGQFGPGNSIQALIFCLLASIIFLWLAKRKNNFLQPVWKRSE
jgi:membrane protease YdiL (CAAX protease family)